MTFTITWWMIPAFLSVISVVFFVIAGYKSRNIIDDMGLWFLGMPVAVINCVAWMIASFFK